MNEEHQNVKISETGPTNDSNRGVAKNSKEMVTSRDSRDF